MSSVLVTDQLAPGEEVELATVPGNEIGKLRATAASGSGTVVAVTGTAPITSSGGAAPNIAITPASDVAAGSMSATDKTKIDGLPATAWDYAGVGVPNTVSNPELFQQPAAAGVAASIPYWRTQADGAGSGGGGGGGAIIMGQNDGPQFVNVFWIGHETAPGGHPSSRGLPGNVDFFTQATFYMTAGGVVGFGLGGGTDNLGTGVVGVEIATERPIGIATENNSPISLIPSNGTGNGQAVWNFLQDSGNGPAVEFTGNIGTPAPHFPPAQSGRIRMPWGANVNLTVQRDAANSTDLPVTGRVAGLLVFGSQQEPCSVQGGNTIAYKVGGAGAGHVFSTPNGNVADFAIDGHSTWVQGDTFPVQFDSVVRQLYHADTSSVTANQVIADITIPPGLSTWALSQVEVKVQGLNPATGDGSCAVQEWSCTISGGVIVLLGTQPAAQDKGHSVAAGAINPQFQVSGSTPNTLQVIVTPWTASALHWTTKVEINVNAGQAPNPAAPPGTPQFWNRADLQGLGPAAVLTDFSGNGNTIPLLGGSTAAVVTANAGPGGTTDAYVTNVLGSIYALASALGFGTSNYTMAVVVQTPNTTPVQIACAVGNRTVGGQLMGLSLNTATIRDFTQSAVTAITDGPGTTNWESWILSVDVAGNQTLLVNGASVPLSPSTSIAAAPSANFTVGGLPDSTGHWLGSFAEVIAYNTEENAAAIYAYVHGWSGL